MAVFIASISKGRTIRQFAFATMGIPAAFLLIWHSTFGATALLNEIQGDGSIAMHALQSPDMTFFAILQTLPLTQFITIVSVILLLFFLATSITSGALALGRMTDAEGRNPAPIRCAVWSLIMAAIALTGIFAAMLGGNDALVAIRSLATTLSYPYMFIFILLTTAFLRQLRIDEARNPTPNPKVASVAELIRLRERIAVLEGSAHTDNADNADNTGNNYNADNSVKKDSESEG
jgi:choline-glycine betaine transporter